MEPDPAIEAAALDNKRVAFPFGGGVSVPRRRNVRMRYEPAAVHERLPPQVECFVDEENDLRRLHDLPWRRREKDLGYALRQAIGVRLFSPELSGCTLVVERLGPRLERNVFLEILREIPQVTGWRVPDAGEIRLAI